MEESQFVHPYMPNSVKRVKQEMMKEVGVDSLDEFYEAIPSEIRLRGKMDLPDPIHSEYLLRKHVEGILDKNVTCQEYLSFLGGGCWQHYVPAVCDEINQRGEFLTAYDAECYQDHGKYQALFEYASMMGGLLNMDLVNIPTYDWLQAAATAIRMASRMNGRSEALVLKSIGSERLAKIIAYCKPDITIKLVEYHPEFGGVDLFSLRKNISEKISAVYFENPSYFGVIEPYGKEISEIVHQYGAECIVGVDPICLGVLTPPAVYGADIVCGDLQPLGIHMQYGGGQAGFIATRDEERYIMEYPSRLFGLVPTRV
jgi:glycine dehydrogenase subunit 1